MDQKAVVSLGRYLNHYIDPHETCDRTLHKTVAWLKANHFDIEAELLWLQNHGVECDCDIVVGLHMPNNPLKQSV
jgi:hypothetical protein